MTTPTHAAGAPIRRPRLWHAGLIVTAGAWVLSALIAPSGCGASDTSSGGYTAAPPAAKATMPPTPTYTTPSVTMTTPATVWLKPGYDRSDLAYCQALHRGDEWEIGKCLVDEGIIQPHPDFAAHDRAETSVSRAIESLETSVSRAVESASSSVSRANAAAVSSASSAQASARSARASADGAWASERNRCEGGAATLAGTLLWVAILVGITTVVLTTRRWRRWRYTVAARELAVAWGEMYPAGSSLIEVGDRDLARAAGAAAHAAREAADGAALWFGGDGEGADELHEIARRAQAEQSARAAGYMVPNPVPSDTAPTEFTVDDEDEDGAIPVALDASSWVTKLQSKGDEW